MEMKNIPFGTTDWADIVPTEHKGETGMALWRTQQFDTVRVRMGMEVSVFFSGGSQCKW